MKKINNTTGNTVPFFPADREYKFLKKELHAALDEVGQSGHIILGPKVSELEQNFSDLIQKEYVVSCASGTDAIILGIKALGIENGDEVILPANSYPSVFGVALSGAKPVLVDIDYETGGIDPKRIEKAITSKTKAILAVHLYGLPVDIEGVKLICQKHNLFLIEDCAQATGSEYENKPTGSFGDIAIFSFYPTKNLGAMGDGGIVATNTAQRFERLKALRMYGEKERYNSEILGMNSRLDELQAAFLIRKLRYLHEWVDNRIKLAGIYRNVLSEITDIELLPEFTDRKNSYHLFPIRTSKRNELMKWLTSHNIQTGIHYPRSIHQTITFKDLGKGKSFTTSEKWNETTLSLPLHPFLTETEVVFVAQKVIEFLNKERKI